MSTLRKAIQISTDENNAIDNLRNVQINKKTIIETTKRAALGELGNRGTTTTISLKGKDGQVKDNFNKEATKHINLKYVAKPRVDTYWKKTTVLANGITTAETVQLKKLKNIKSLITATSAAPVNTQPIETVRTRAATKAIATKVNIVQKSKDDVLPALKREDSHLSRLAVNKLRTALAKDNKKVDNSSIISKDNNEKPITTTTTTIIINNNKITNDEISSSTINNKHEIQHVKIKESDITSHSAKMLNVIENIDKNDGENLGMVQEYVNDIYSYLYNVEILLPIEINFMKNQAEVTPRMRSVLLDWIIEVIGQFHLIPETYQMTVSIIDRYLQCVSTTTRNNLQLVGAAAIFIAAKYEELFPPDISDFVYITDSTYSKSQMLKMEMKILKALDFQLYRPVPLLFLRRFSKAGKAETQHYICSKYIIELVSIEYSLAHYKPSEIAASALFLSMQLFNKNNISIDKLWTPTLQYYSCYNIEQLKPIVKKIAKIVYNAPQAKQRAVYKKYQASKFDHISTNSELYGPVISKLIPSSE